MKVIADAVQSATKIVGGLLADMQGEKGATDQDKMRVYTPMRGNPQALIMYAIAHAPKGSNSLAEAHRYEADMERIYAAQNKGGQ